MKKDNFVLTIFVILLISFLIWCVWVQYKDDMRKEGAYNKNPEQFCLREYKETAVKAIPGKCIIYFK